MKISKEYNNKMRFVRFGEMRAFDQTNRWVNDNFHAPPHKSGFYAFLWPYYEPFLLGATDHPSNPSRKSAWVKDDNGNKIKVDMDNDVLPLSVIKFIKKNGLSKKDISQYPLVKGEYDDNNIFYAYQKKPHIFEYNGDIWHHLDVKEIKNDVLQRVGSWVKTSMKTYERAVPIYFSEMLHFGHNTDFLKNDPIVKQFHLRGTNPYKSGIINVSKDELEVFIEKI